MELLRERVGQKKRCELVQAEERTVEGEGGSGGSGEFLILERSGAGGMGPVLHGRAPPHEPLRGGQNAPAGMMKARPSWPVRAPR